LPPAGILSRLRRAETTDTLDIIESRPYEGVLTCQLALIMRPVLYTAIGRSCART